MLLVIPDRDPGCGLEAAEGLRAPSERQAIKASLLTSQVLSEPMALGVEPQPPATLRPRPHLRPLSVLCPCWPPFPHKVLPLSV